MLIAGCLLVFGMSVPGLAVMIRQLDPGREKTPEMVKYGPQGVAVPETGPFVAASCPEPCRLGTWVKLFAGRTERPGYLALWAEAEGAERIWYYPTAKGFMPEVAASAEQQVLSEAIKLSRSHDKASLWTFHMHVQAEPSARDAVLSQPDSAIIAKTKFSLALGDGERQAPSAAPASTPTSTPDAATAH